MRIPVLALTLLTMLAAAACGLVPDRSGDPIVDTWPIGEPIDCAQQRSCDELIRVGLAGLDERDPGHAAVVSSRLHAEGVLIDPASGNQILTTRSGGCCQVLVVRLADGSTSAIGVGFPGISPEAVAIPWEMAPGG